MKKYFLPVMACVAMFLCSCQKENIDSPIVNSSSSANAASEADALTISLLPKATIGYGAMINPPDPNKNFVGFQVSVASQIGVTCLRARTLVPTKSPNPMLSTGYKVLLNLNASEYKGTARPFVTDLNKYKTDLISTISVCLIKPAVAVIDNEESNRFYYSGTAQQYIDQLSVAINVLHSYGVKVANGGITDQGLNYLVYQDLLNQGKTDSAEQFKKLVNVVPKLSTTIDRGAFVDKLLQAYTQMDLDYINFHWKGTSPDTQAVGQVIAYLKKRTGKPVISNEFGQFDTDPNTLSALLQKATDTDFPYVIWYSPDEHAGLKDTPLNHSDASLTNSGFAYKSYLKN